MSMLLPDSWLISAFPVLAGDHRTGEQPALNYAIRRVEGLRFRTLPRALYPNGASYFDRDIRPAKGQRPYIVHNNWISGLAPKRERFERHAMWLVGAGADSQCVYPPGWATSRWVLLPSRAL